MTTTNTTTAIALNDKLAPVFQKAFQDLLSQARIEPNFHSRLKEALKKFNLLSYRQFSPFKPKEIHVEQDKLADSRYRRSLIRQLKAPRPSPYVNHTFSMEPAELFSGKDQYEYLLALSQYMAQIAASRLGETQNHQALIITRLAAHDLLAFLESHKLYELEAEHLSNFILRQLCQRVIEENPRYQAAVAMIAKTGKEARERFLAESRAIREESMQSLNKSLDAITAEVNRRVDEYLSRLAQEQAERQAQEKLEADKRAEEAALNAGKTEEQIFAESVKKREIAYRKANPTHIAVKIVYWAGAIALAVGFALFGEVNGVPVPELLGFGND